MARTGNPYRLTLRGTYILPTRQGLMQLLGWTLLTAASLNFGLGVMLLFSLLLAAIALVCMVETVRNLAGLQIELLPPAPVEAGSQAEFTVVLLPLDGRARHAVRVALTGTPERAGWRARLGLQTLRHAVRCDVAAGGTQLILALDSSERGRLLADRVLIASTWPLGLFRAWRHWQPEISATVHPEALRAPFRQPGQQARDHASTLLADRRAPSGDGDAHGDFLGHRRRQPADAFRRIDWRTSLRAGIALVAQRDAATSGAPLWLRWQDHTPADPEIRLARLTTAVLAAARQQRRFALELPDRQLPPGAGAAHRDLALRLLAEFPSADAPGRVPVSPATTPAAVPGKSALDTAALGHWTLTVLLAALPLAIQLPANAWLPWLALMTTRIWLLRSGVEAPGTAWLAFGALAGAGWIFTRYHAVLGREPGMALLLIMAGLKLLEARRERDLHTLAVLSFFLLLSAHFRNQTPWLALWDLLCAALVLDGLLAAQQGGRRSARIGTLLRMTALAAPLALLLFVLLPRPDHPFWGFGHADEGLSGGLSDHMSPGSVSRLRLSEAVAFRVRFTGSWPARARLYWRGPVLDLFDGQNWSVATRLASAPAPVIRDHGTQMADYSYQAEPAEGDWVFALEQAEAAEDGLQSDGEGVIHVRTRGSQQRPWHLHAWPDARPPGGLDGAARAIDLEVPPGNPLARAMAEPWRAMAPAARIAAAEKAFLDARLSYSLDGPPAGVDAIDDLLFGTRNGYCEHFSSAFAFLLRVAGIPARVVTGYQGGEKNPLGSYLIVRQSDAHAWVEAWLDERGWVRIDPTALTVPALLQGGSQVAAPLPEPGWMPPFVRAGLPALHRLQLLRDLAVMQWRRNIAAVDAEQQRAWFESLGLGSVDKAQLAAACALLVSAALGIQLLLAARSRLAPSPSDARARPERAGFWQIGTAWRQTRQARIQRRWTRCWALGEWLLRRNGWQRAADEAPLHYLQRIALAEPRLEPALRSWGDACLQGIYGRADQADAPGAGGRLWPLCKGLLRSYAAVAMGRPKPAPSGRD